MQGGGDSARGGKDGGHNGQDEEDGVLVHFSGKFGDVEEGALQPKDVHPKGKLESLKGKIEF